MTTSIKIVLTALFILSGFNLVKINDKGISLSHNMLLAQDNSSYWTNISGSDNSSEPKRISPLKYRNVRLDLGNLRSLLLNSPFELSDRALSSPLTIDLPMPDGSMSKFYVTEYSMMEPGLSAQYPEIKTYNIKGIDDPYAVGKIDITVAGFHGMVMTPNGDYFIDPAANYDTENYISYFKSDCFSQNGFQCEVIEDINQPDNGGSNNNIFATSGTQLRTYRLAVAATGEYTAFFGGTVALGQAAVVTAVNRVNGVYEREFSVRLTLVANNSSIIYTNSATDPYTNSNGGTMLGQNQTTCTNVIGSANYDIGHVFSTGGGGVAGLGVVCSSTNKARGVTGGPSPTGDSFWIDYVAHEMGHQFRGNHSFNSVTSNCGGGNRNSTTAWEPGSGSTIMAYAGICGADDLQPNSNDYFHSGNFEEIANFTQTGTGSGCPVVTSTGNTAPTVTVPAGGFTIPINTPFALTGSATDVESPGTLTYCWEEFDVGPSGSPNSPTGNAPIFRSFSPVTSPTRTFPKLSNLLNNTSTIGEILPSYTRNLSFRMTVRDNSVGGGGVNYALISFAVNSTGGAFSVTQPNTNVTWNTGVPQTVTWNAGSTASSPFNVSTVNIKLSVDGGNTYPTTLLAGTPNDGSESVILPGGNTTLARIKVEAAGNIFFDISNTNFTINTTTVPSTFNIIQEGYYNTITGNLNKRDTVRFYLRNAVSPFALVDSGKTIIDSLTFSGNVTFSTAPTGSYYIVAKGKNILETWSNAAVTYTVGSALSYDFTTGSSQAYGGNMVLKGSKYCVYSGEVFLDNEIDLVDATSVTNKANSFAAGEQVTDLNGDRVVDLEDIMIVFNNAQNFVSRQAPPGAFSLVKSEGNFIDIFSQNKK